MDSHIQFLCLTTCSAGLSRASLADSAVRLNTRSMNATVSDGQKRKDAARNRSAILDAARGLFAESADVYMCEVARRAGVGQATLYRNFPDRRALAAELLDEHVRRLARVAGECAGDPDAFFVLLRCLVETVVDLYALGELAREDASVGSQFQGARECVAELMKRPLADAKAAGALCRDASLEDVFLVVAMARGAMARANGATARASAASRVLTLALEGLVPPTSRH
jgi:AcrR family transcriptional regulator